MRNFKKTEASLLPMLLIVMLLIGNPIFASAEVIQFPDEELASESVLPVFDQPDAVKNKNILTTQRFEAGLGIGLSLLEPFYNPYSVSLSGGYHFDEQNGVNFLMTYFMQGLSSNGAGLNPIPNKVPTTNANLQYAPAPQYLILGNYQYTGFYGKISLNKDYVMHLDLYGMAGGGTIVVGDGIFPILNFGIGQKFYFSNSFALRMDFRFLAYQGPDVLSKALDTASSPKPSSYFASKTNYMSLLNLGAVILF